MNLLRWRGETLRLNRLARSSGKRISNWVVDMQTFRVDIAIYSIVRDQPLATVRLGPPLTASLPHCEITLNLGEGHRGAVEGGHDLLGERAQMGDRGPRRGEQHILDAARFEPLQLADDLLR